MSPATPPTRGSNAHRAYLAAADLAAAWLGGIIRLSYSGHYDVALHNFGLMLGALIIARLASKYEPSGLSFVNRG